MLTRAGAGWIFVSEKALEDFIWSNLKLLFPVQAIARQFCCSGETCDIVATGSKQELVILELKNSEDRYLVQQLTRYYENLMGEQPWSEKINYDQPVKLIGIAPNFHRHSLIDQKHLKLTIEFFTFAIKRDNNGTFWFSLQRLNQQEISRVKIPYTEVNLSSVDFPSPPPSFVDILGSLPLLQKRILRIREHILKCDPQIKEFEGKNTIMYGSSAKAKYCAELIFDGKTKQLILFLWLPLQQRASGLVAGRHRVWTDWDKVTHLAAVGEGLGDKKTLDEWLEHYKQKDIAQGKKPRTKLFDVQKDKVGNLRMGAIPRSQKVAKQISSYDNRVGYPKNDRRLITIVDISLEMWRKKMGY
jgi:hypothetical protein